MKMHTITKESGGFLSPSQEDSNNKKKKGGKNFLPKRFEVDDDVVRLSPIAKFLKYRKIPTKLILDIILCVVVTLVAYFITKNRHPYLSQQLKSFSILFLPQGYTGTSATESIDPSYKFFEIEDAVAEIKRIVQKYYKITDLSTHAYILDPKNLTLSVETRPRSPRKDIYPLLDTNPAHMFYAPTPSRSLSLFPPSGVTGAQFFSSGRRTVTEIVDTNNPLGSFFGETNPEKLRENADRLIEAKIEMNFLGIDVSEKAILPSCLRWLVSINLKNYYNGGYWIVSVSNAFEDCRDTVFEIFIREFTRIGPILSIILAVGSVLSLCLNAKAVLERAYYFAKKKYILRSKLKHQRKIGSKISWLCKGFSYYFPFWYVVAFGKDTFNILGFLGLVWPISASTSEILFSFINLSFGLGALLSFVNVLKYFQYFPRFYLLVLTFTRAFPLLSRFFLGAFPIFLAFALAGPLFFGYYSEYFLDFNQSSTTLFASCFGDEERPIFDRLYGFSDFHRVLGRVFLYTFEFSHITVIFHFFLVITEGVFFKMFDAKKDVSKKPEKKPKKKKKSFNPQQQRRSMTIEQSVPQLAVSLLLNDSDQDGAEDNIRTQIIVNNDVPISNIDNNNNSSSSGDIDLQTKNLTSPTTDQERDVREVYVDLVTDALYERLMELQMNTISEEQLELIEKLDSIIIGFFNNMTNEFKKTYSFSASSATLGFRKSTRLLLSQLNEEARKKQVEKLLAEEAEIEMDNHILAEKLHQYESENKDDGEDAILVGSEGEDEEEEKEK